MHPPSAPPAARPALRFRSPRPRTGTVRHSCLDSCDLGKMAGEICVGSAKAFSGALRGLPIPIHLWFAASQRERMARAYGQPEEWVVLGSPLEHMKGVFKGQRAADGELEIQRWQRGIPATIRPCVHDLKILDSLPVAVLRPRRDGIQSTSYEHGFRVGFKGNYAGRKEEKYFINIMLLFLLAFSAATISGGLGSVLLVSAWWFWCYGCMGNLSAISKLPIHDMNGQGRHTTSLPHTRRERHHQNQPASNYCLKATMMIGSILDMVLLLGQRNHGSHDCCPVMISAYQSTHGRLNPPPSVQLLANMEEGEDIAERSGKSSVFIDKRTGEQSDELGEFDKAILRSQRECQLKLYKKSKYNLSDGEEDEFDY
ncbi:hypothetical protein RHSIM_Rhsim04G0142900 [Rhododendron simsii]|uniref:Uncharacterized protein n=1 Tax=Rhododendron simsii TaxID=118357 RepID=A0A834H563_RHOSS|nr:hypothetical protein RHSIM_Rhsim04G0142900 [Rhododendron simsii]